MAGLARGGWEDEDARARACVSPPRIALKIL